MNRIRELREEKHITQVRLSIELEVSQETISAYEIGKHYPSVAALIRLRDIFDVSIDYILGLTDVRSTPIQRSGLREEESRLIKLYRKLDPAGQERILGYAEGYLAAMNDCANR